jgi:hypothetical protein
VDSIHFGNIRVSESFVKLSDLFYRVPSKPIFSVARLFCWRNPPAIVRVVTQVIVNTVNRQVVCVTSSNRPISKSLKTSPLWADNNVCSTVSQKICIGWISAPLVHTLPNFVKPTPAHVMLGKRLSASAWTAVQALSGMVCSPLKDFLTTKTSKLKVFSGFHLPLQKVSVVYNNNEWGNFNQ